MAGFFCITRISGTSHKIGRNFSQDLPHLVTRYQASRFLASFYVLFCGHIPLPVGNMPLPKNCPKTSEGKISVLLCVYKETGETTGRINKSS